MDTNSEDSNMQMDCDDNVNCLTCKCEHIATMTPATFSIARSTSSSVRPLTLDLAYTTATVAPSASEMSRFGRLMNRGSDATVLKRSCSAPLINNLMFLDTAEASTSASLSPVWVPPLVDSSLGNRARHNSVVLDLRLHSVSQPIAIKPVRSITPLHRVSKIKHDDDVKTCIAEESRNERTFLTAAKASTSWNEFSLDEDAASVDEQDLRKRRTSLTEPMHIFTSYHPASSSPSPSRAEKQCFSPSMQQVIKHITYSPISSPSPTRQAQKYMRSLSPIAVRAPVGLKRKCESDTEGVSSPKRHFYGSPAGTPDRTNAPSLPPVPLEHSLSASSLDSESSNSTLSSMGDIVPSLPTSFHCPSPGIQYGAINLWPPLSGAGYSGRKYSLSASLGSPAGFNSHLGNGSADSRSSASVTEDLVMDGEMSA